MPLGTLGFLLMVATQQSLQLTLDHVRINALSCLVLGYKV